VGNDVLRFELRSDGDGTELRFLDTFDELGKAARDAAGWHVCFDNLDRRLAGDVPDLAAWERVEPEYRAAYPPATSTIGPPAAVKRSR
jgi:hypothetical protein